MEVSPVAEVKFTGDIKFFNVIPQGIDPRLVGTAFGKYLFNLSIRQLGCDFLCFPNLIQMGLVRILVVEILLWHPPADSVSSLIHLMVSL